MPHLSPLCRFSDGFVWDFRSWPKFFAVLRFWMIFSSVLRFLIHPNFPLGTGVWKYWREWKWWGSRSSTSVYICSLKLMPYPFREWAKKGDFCFLASSAVRKGGYHIRNRAKRYKSNARTSFVTTLLWWRDKIFCERAWVHNGGSALVKIFSCQFVTTK